MDFTEIETITQVDARNHESYLRRKTSQGLKDRRTRTMQTGFGHRLCGNGTLGIEGTGIELCPTSN